MSQRAPTRIPREALQLTGSLAEKWRRNIFHTGLS